MAEHKLKIETREATGKKTRALRKQGLIPGVLYGGKTPLLVQSAYVPTEKTLDKVGYHSPVELVLDGKNHLAIVKDVQIDPVHRRIVNVEFQAIKRNEVVEATTPVVIVGFEESEASRDYHFELTQAIEELEIKAKPADLPEELEVSAANLASLDDKIVLSDITLPEGVELADKELELDQVVASLYDPAAEAAAREKEVEEAEAEIATAESGESSEAETTEEAKSEEASE